MHTRIETYCCDLCTLDIVTIAVQKGKVQNSHHSYCTIVGFCTLPVVTLSQLEPDNQTSVVN